MRSLYEQSGLYRSNNGIFFGVCSGFADYFGFSVLWIRIITLAAMVITGLWPIIGLYFLAVLLMRQESTY
jgi:phage shock protein C